jgi:membrane protein implicated in regulation of membrane protease activity
MRRSADVVSAPGPIMDPMDIPLAWLIGGFLLIIVELLTGTFYLLVLGIAALLASAIGYAGGAFVWQSVGAAVIAIVGVVWVRRRHRASAPSRMQGLDFGSPTSFESWVDRSSARARVRYRDAQWDARVTGDVSGDPGEILYITAIDGNTLTVSKSRPA